MTWTKREHDDMRREFNVDGVASRAWSSGKYFLPRNHEKLNVFTYPTLNRVCSAVGMTCVVRTEINRKKKD